ncbi:MAG TPA: endolytic transglycosylase MltG [Acidiphilium sp.]|nr:MAG: aminodeoxychorismate lyase [Acidiphilium sp. 21-60-14]OYV92388.1 MAG: aminodeoxychorismate lyase [Acidiphilium sp. 37-60-79]HQT89194.1 endolytic transglycosylase MltG [Acidiphilium sp.]HQU24418.1 endolytic transglycosylase MltG [Acidiphilium sp.]
MTRWRRWVLPLWTLVIVLGMLRTAIQESYNGPGSLPVTKNVTIPPGGLQTIAHVLDRAGVIRYKLIFELAAYFTRGQGKLRAGEFRFIAHGSLRETLNTLRTAPVVEHPITLPPGLTATQIAAIINQAPHATGQIAAPPQGSILPQTFDYPSGTSRAAILARAQAALRHALEAQWSHRAANLPLATPRQALILASIVQLETPLRAELPKIAAVYENRLKRGMKLQADPTVIFAATQGRATALDHPITRADLNRNNPYNTYENNGLPPGPICAPGLAALHAVLHPAPINALYFVATGHGGHVFARHFKTQRANIARYRAAHP